MLKRLTLLLAISLLLLATPASANNRVIFMNGCKYPVNLMIKYARTTRNWVPLGWWNIPSGEERRLQYPDGSDVIHLFDHLLYYYAVVPNNPKIEWRASTDYDTTSFEGKTYHLRGNSGEKNTNSDTYITLTCTNN